MLRVVAPYIRTVTTASGATAVQIVYGKRAGKLDLEHVGSAHDGEELALLRAAAAQRMAAGQDELDLGLERAGAPPPRRRTRTARSARVPITSSRAEVLIEALNAGFDALGLDAVAGGDAVFRQMVLARIIEPTSKKDSLRVLAETGIEAVSYPTVVRHLPRYSSTQFRDEITRALASRASLGPTSLVLFDVSTLYFETDKADELRKPGFSKERRLEPQITIGLLTDEAGRPLLVEAFEGNKAETLTMLPVIRHFQDAYRVEKVTVVADAGMVSDSNKKALDAAGLGFIIGARLPQMPYVIETWNRQHPGQQFADGQIFTQPWPAGPTDDRRDHWFYYQYKHDRARRTLRGIDEQVTKAEKALAGQAAVKRNRFVKLTGGTRSLNQPLIDKTRSLAGLKSYVTNLPPEQAGAQFVIGAYHRLFQIEKSFRMAKSDLAARPIYARREDSIRAHLNIVLAAMAVARWIEDATGWSTRRFVTTARQHRTVTLDIDGTAITAANPLPDDLADAIDHIEERADETINQHHPAPKTGQPVDNDPRD